MKKIGTATPINCITKENDGLIFELFYNDYDNTITAKFIDGTDEEACDICYAMYAMSISFIYEQEDF